MRRVHVLAGVGAALLLASCSDRPNDLRDSKYYEGPRPPQSSAPPVPTTQQTPRPAAAPTPAPKALELDRFALTAADLAEEGVQRTGTARTVQPSLADCEASLGKAKAAYQTTWSYPTGSTIRQYLAEYDGPAEAVITAARGELTCGKYQSGGAEVRVSAPVEGGEGQVSWCATSSRQSACTVLKAEGPVLSVVVVTAATETKAKPAVTRIAPLAATALGRNS